MQGHGYAWIMLNFETLSDENKDRLFDLEKRKDSQGNPIGEKGIWFLRPGMNFQLCAEKLKKDERLEKFENKSIILKYDGARYSSKTVVIRMPIDENTTVQEVEEYFVKFAENLKEQMKENEVDFYEK